jgi:hypothetical protein
VAALSVGLLFLASLVLFTTLVLVPLAIRRSRALTTLILESVPMVRLRGRSRLRGRVVMTLSPPVVILMGVTTAALLVMVLYLLLLLFLVVSLLVASTTISLSPTIDIRDIVTEDVTQHVHPLGPATLPDRRDVRVLKVHDGGRGALGNGPLVARIVPLSKSVDDHGGWDDEVDFITLEMHDVLAAVVGLEWQGLNGFGVVYPHHGHAGGVRMLGRTTVGILGMMGNHHGQGRLGRGREDDTVTHRECRGLKWYSGCKNVKCCLITWLSRIGS